MIQKLLSAIGLPVRSLRGERAAEDAYEDDVEGFHRSELDEQAFHDRGGTPGKREETRSDVLSPIVRADPKNMDQATVVADVIKRQHPVLLNLQSAAEPEARRIRDFLAGVTYGCDGYMRRVAEWVYVCAPCDMPVEKLVLDGPRTGEPRYETPERRLWQEDLESQ